MTPAQTLSTAPDWSKQAEEILCPLCDYNLRGLTEPRCPECGHTFEWDKLVDPAQRTHPYLFEHHRRRNVWSFVLTVRGALWPGEFWRSLHPAQPSRPGRLLLFWFICTAMVLLPAALMFALACVDYYGVMLKQRQSVAGYWAANPEHSSSVIRSFGSITNGLDQYFPLPPSPRFFLYAMSSSTKLGALASWTLGYVAWPWITATALMLFQITMRRARIRFSHLTRCTIYSADVTPAVVAMLLVGIALTLRAGGMAYGVALRLPTVAIAILWLVPTWRLMVACGRYLRIPAAAITVLLTQIIFFLLLAKVALDCFRIDYLRELFEIWRV